MKTLLYRIDSPDYNKENGKEGDYLRYGAYDIRPADEKDLPAILGIYAAARKFMSDSGNPSQWGQNHPPEPLLRGDIKEGNLYVLENDRIRGVFAFIPGEDPTYARIYDGAWRSDRPYGTIHRIAGDGSGGIFAACVAFCRDRCGYLRVDTHADNIPMQRAIRQAGFLKCGIITIGDGSERLAYDLL